MKGTMMMGKRKSPGGLLKKIKRKDLMSYLPA
jgi:hypothetical protein